jgi:hypothetical protein
MKRDGSLNKLVNEKHLGPSALKERKPLANWPKENSNPSSNNHKFDMSTPNKSKKELPPYMKNDHQDDEDYEEGFEEGVVEDDGADEIEKLKLAMEREKLKA